jgi:hypothetical protein
MVVRQRWAKMLGVLTAVASVVAVTASPASADPTFQAMNAAGGIYWRSAPDWSTAIAQPGNGVYDDTTIAVHCHAGGTAVPGSGNTMWEQATVVGGSGHGSGWINEHFINDGTAIDQPSPGVPPCDQPSGPAGPRDGGPTLITPPSTGTPSVCSSTPGSGDSVTRWNPVIVCVLGMLAQPAGGDVVHAVDVLVEHESSGDPNAVNLWDGNARAGHPSQGLIQTIPSTFHANRSPLLADDVFDPAANLYAGLGYGINRYGSITDIPGIRNVLDGVGYVGYAAPQTKGLKRAGRCGSVHAGRTTLGLTAHGATCAAARRAVRTLDRSAAVRHAVGLAHNLRVTAVKHVYVCDVDAEGRRGATRAVFCQSGSRTLWWSARRR